jgi:hypothetical protein
LLDWRNSVAEEFGPTIFGAERAVDEISCWHDGWRR